jgi:hypothetical protein
VVVATFSPHLPDSVFIIPSATNIHTCFPVVRSRIVIPARSRSCH